MFLFYQSVFFCVFCIVLCTEHNSCNINYFRHCGLPTMPRLSTKYPTNISQNVHIQPRNTPHFIPQGVGTDSLCLYFHIIKYTYPFQQIRIFTLSNVRFCSPFCGCLHICKHHKIVHQRTLATPYGTTTYTECLLLQCKNHTFARQKGGFCIMV